MYRSQSFTTTMTIHSSNDYHALLPRSMSLFTFNTFSKKENLKRNKCGICLEQSPCRLRSVCDNHCVMCISCARDYWRDWIENSRYLVVAPKCLCRQPIQLEESIWDRLVGESSSIKHQQNMQSQFVVRCPSCDEDHNFWYSGKVDEEKVRKMEKQIFDRLNDVQKQNDLVNVINEYVTYKIVSPKKVVDLILITFGSKLGRLYLTPKDFRGASSDIDSESENEEEEECKEHWSLVDGDILNLFINPERRATIQLEWLRREEARVSTSCCDREICFRCKYEDWHEGETCEEIMEQTKEEAPGDTIFTCPACFVPCVHAGGCSSVRCLCGHSYELDSLDDDDDDDDTDEEEEHSLGSKDDEVFSLDEYHLNLFSSTDDIVSDMISNKSDSDEEEFSNEDSSEDSSEDEEQQREEEDDTINRPLPNMMKRLLSLGGSTTTTTTTTTTTSALLLLLLLVLLLLLIVLLLLQINEILIQC